MSLSAFQGQQTSRQTSPFKRSRHQQLLQSPDMMRIRRRPDNDRRVPNDKRRPSKLAPPIDDSLMTACDINSNGRRPTAISIPTDDDRLRYEQVTTSTILTQLRTTDLECSYMFYTSLHGQQSHHMALYHRGKGASLWQFDEMGCRQ
ncbi:hypothetical protein RAB80_014895 [Fusarium oxysporum f. sp. vasinfectum]|nr:hypothetical protein RAB80_014895 [Fusarium oxysporum f. sp. vasinfectum]KAK2924930.1 hypothetical protein FoTM2_015208 [Fusarium oxysporum f. sp. vasinfectum]